MFKKTITFEDFNGNKKTRDFYFHISKSEIAALGAGAEGMMARIQRIIDAKDGLAIREEFIQIIKLACGIRTGDGERFIKTPEAQSTLLDSPALDVLLMEMFINENAATEFVRQLIPDSTLKEMLAQVEAEKQNAKIEFPGAVTNPNTGDVTIGNTRLANEIVPDYIREKRKPTQAELMDMSHEEMRLYLMSGAAE